MKSGDEKRSVVDRRVADRRKHERSGSGEPDRRTTQRRDSDEHRQKDQFKA